MILYITSKTSVLLPKVVYKSSPGFKTLKHTLTDINHIYDPKFAVNSCSFFSKKQQTDEQLLKRFEKIQSLTILTYNVWASLFNYKNRYRAILQILADHKPDIICLQQVTDLFYHKLTSDQLTKNCLKHYYMAQTERNWSDTLILSKYPCKFYQQPFINSRMGRSILAAGLYFKSDDGADLKVGVNCIHLESRSNSSQKIKQLKVIEQFNINVDFSIIAGDFNFGDQQLQQNYVGQYKDLWKIAKKKFSKSANYQLKTEGFTMAQSSTQPNWRPDRIIYKYNKQKKQQQQVKDKCANQIEVIGYSTVEPFKQQSFSAYAKDDIVRTASDHFGLLGKIYL